MSKEIFADGIRARRACFGLLAELQRLARREPRGAVYAPQMLIIGTQF